MNIDQGWTVPVKQLRLMLHVAERLDLNQDELLRLSGIDKYVLQHAEQQVSVTQVYQLYKNIAQLADNQDIGLYTGRSSYLNLVDVLLYLSSICVSLRQWLRMMPSVLETYGDLGKAIIVKENGCLRSEWQPLVPLDVSGRYTVDMALSISSAILNSICLQPIIITKAQFTYPEPQDLHALKQCFGDNLLFGQPYSAIYFDVECLGYGLIQANTDLDNQANPWQNYIENVAGDDFLQLLRQSIVRTLPTGEMSIDNVAQELGISRRTLQRRLSERETSFQDVVQDLRSQMALRFLADNKMGITSIAFLLGYSDSSSFSGAFKIWHGCAPSKYIPQ